MPSKPHRSLGFESGLGDRRPAIINSALSSIAESAWGDAHNPSEVVGQVALIAKSALLGDFCQSALGMGEQMPGTLDALVDEVLVRCQSRCLLEPSREMEGTEPGGA